MTNHPDQPLTTEKMTKYPQLTNVNHELRTPLHAIIGLSSILCEGGFSKEYKELILQNIHSNSRLLLNMTEQINDILLLDLDLIRIDPKKAELNELCREIIARFEINNPAIPPIKFKAAKEFLFIETDNEYFSKIFIQLITNAIRHSANKPVKISYLVKKTIICFYITDEGEGIPLPYMKDVFKRGIRLDSNHSGLGMGLFICKEILNQLGGKIWIDPNYQKGCRVIFTHPLKKI
ncbi:MAG: sensor histidine kinase [Bacteroidales bacterium]